MARQATPKNQMTIRGLLDWGEQSLKEAGIQSARSESEWALSHVLACRMSALYLENAPITESQRVEFVSIIGQRLEGRPLQYVLGEAFFYGRRFVVNPSVLIPRPETERLAQVVLEAISASGWQQRPLRVLELGSGSGCLSVTLADELPACVVVSVDVSYGALAITRINAQAQQVASRVFFVCGNWMSALNMRADVIVSNPPYIPSDQVDQLSTEVKQEPRLSLDGGSDGMRDLLQLIREAPKSLASCGILALECGEDQVETLADQAQSMGVFASIVAWRDLAGRPRGILARLPEDA